MIEECLRTGEPIVRRQVAIRSNNPRITHFGVSVSPLTDGQNELHGVICLFTDLTPVIEMEEQLRLKDSLARVGELTAGIAHEFRNGLATIHGYARLLDLNAMPRRTRPHLEGIRQETDSLGQVVTNFLNFAKQAKVSMSPVDLQAIAERAADEVRTEARAHGGIVRVQGDFPVIDGDDVLFEAGVQQSASQRRRGRHWRLEGAGRDDYGPRRRRARARVSGRQRTGHTGVRTRARVHALLHDQTRWTGLGLALVQKIIVTHDGRIQVGRSPQGGASLQVILPIAAAPESASA